MYDVYFCFLCFMFGMFLGLLIALVLHNTIGPGGWKF